MTKKEYLSAQKSAEKMRKQENLSASKSDVLQSWLVEREPLDTASMLQMLASGFGVRGKKLDKFLLGQARREPWARILLASEWQLYRQPHNAGETIPERLLQFADLLIAEEMAPRAGKPGTAPRDWRITFTHAWLVAEGYTNRKARRQISLWLEAAANSKDMKDETNWQDITRMAIRRVTGQLRRARPKAVHKPGI